MSIMWQDNEGYWHSSKADRDEANKVQMDLIAANLSNNFNNTNTEAMRFDDNKLRLDLIPVEAMIELARVYTMGALKYDDDNWRKGMPWSKCIRAALSHLFKWRLGQTIDKETGCHHLAMASWNCLTLLVYQMNKSGKDDRIKAEVDDNFNWNNNHLGIGLSDERISELKNKYKEKK